MPQQAKAAFDLETLSLYKISLNIKEKKIIDVMIASNLTMCFATHTSCFVPIICKEASIRMAQTYMQPRLLFSKTEPSSPFYPYDGRLHDGTEVGRELAARQDFCLRRIKLLCRAWQSDSVRTV